MWIFNTIISTTHISILKLCSLKILYYLLIAETLGVPADIEGAAVSEVEVLMDVEVGSPVEFEKLKSEKNKEVNSTYIFWMHGSWDCLIHQSITNYHNN